MIETNEAAKHKQMLAVMMATLDVDDAIGKLDNEIKRAYAYSLSLEDDLMVLISLSKRLDEIIQAVFNVEEKRHKGNKT